MRKEFAAEARNKLHNEYQNLTMQDFAKNDQKTRIAVRWVISCAGNLDSGFGKDVEVAWEKYKKVGLDNEVAYQDFMEWVYKLDADLDTYFKSDWKSRIQPQSTGTYINEDIIKRYQAKTSKFNYGKLIAMLEELNTNYDQGNIYGSSMLLRAIIDHIPPLLGKITFLDVVNQYPWGGDKSSKLKSIKELERFRNIPDDVLHSQISKKDEVVDMSYLPNKYCINTLLEECLISNIEPTDNDRKPAENHILAKPRTPEHYPAVAVILEQSGGNPYGIKLSFVNNGDKPAILEELLIGDTINIPLNKQSLLAANNEPRQFGTLTMEGSDIRRGQIKNPTLKIKFRDMAGQKYITTYNVLTKERADKLYNIEALSDLNIETI